MTEHITARLLREKEVPRAYGFSQPWLKKRCRLNLPPDFVRVGRTIYYERSALEEFIAGCRVAHGSVEEK
jgi:predicted DNA-binding transcriptional regulator AlpA